MPARSGSAPRGWAARIPRPGITSPSRNDAASLTGSSRRETPTSSVAQASETETGGPEVLPPARSAGRGVLSVGGAKMLFVLLGLVTTWAVPRLLGSPAAYGHLTTVTTALAILTNTLTTASVQTTSKLVSEGNAAASLLRRSWLFAAIVGGVSALAFFVAGPLLATFVFADPALGPLFSIAALVLLAVPVYATGIGALNGAQRFGAQARLDAGFSVGRTLGLVGGAALGLGALGAVAGYTVAVVLLSLATLATVGLGAREGARGLRPLAALFVPIAAYTVLSNGVLQLDVELLKAIGASVHRDGGMTATLAAELASTEVGLYRAAQSLAIVPYQLSIALTLVVFPLVSRATSTGDLGAARAAVADALRFLVLWLVFCEAPLAGTGARAIDLVFPASFVAGADALSILALSQTLFALFALACTVLTGAGRPWQAAGAALAGLVVVVVVTPIGIFFVGPDGPVRVAAATGAALGALIGLVVAIVLVRRLLGPVVPWATLARATIAGAVGYAASYFVPLEGALGAIAALAAGVIGYVVTVILLGESLRPPRGPRAHSADHEG